MRALKARHQSKVAAPDCEDAIPERRGHVMLAFSFKACMSRFQRFKALTGELSLGRWPRLLHFAPLALLDLAL